MWENDPENLPQNDPDFFFPYLVKHDDMRFYTIPEGYAFAYYYDDNWHIADRNFVLLRVKEWRRLEEI